MTSTTLVIEALVGFVQLAEYIQYAVAVMPLLTVAFMGYTNHQAVAAKAITHQIVFKDDLVSSYKTDRELLLQEMAIYRAMNRVAAIADAREQPVVQKPVQKRVQKRIPAKGLFAKPELMLVPVPKMAPVVVTKTQAEPRVVNLFTKPELLVPVKAPQFDYDFYSQVEELPEYCYEQVA